MENFVYTTQEMLIFCGFAIFGMVCHIIKKLANKEAVGQEIDIRKWGKSHLFRNLSALVGCIAGVFIGAYVGSFTGGMNIAIAILIGYTGDSLLASRGKKFKEQIDG